jgi:hypothetical protein
MERFIFHGEVVALGVRLERPRLRHVRGSVALPGIGGRVSACAKAPDLGSLLRFDYATSSLSGETRGKIYETRAACTLEGLEIPGLLRVDLLSSVLTSRYDAQHMFHEESVVIEGLRIHGREYVVGDRNLASVRLCPTWAQVQDAAKQLASGTGGALAAKPALATAFKEADTPADPKTGVAIPTHAGAYACYLLEAHAPEPGEGPKAVITVPAGKTTFQIVIGEYLIAERQRRLTLVRIEARPTSGTTDREMGCTSPMTAPPGSGLQGSMSFGESLINGQTHP